MLILIFTEKRSFRLTVDEALSRLQKSAFRAKFHLSDEDINYIDKKGLDTVKSHAEDFIKKRLAPAVIPTTVSKRRCAVTPCLRLSMPAPAAVEGV